MVMKPNDERGVSRTVGASTSGARVRVWNRGGWAATERITGGGGQRGTGEGLRRIVQQTGGSEAAAGMVGAPVRRRREGAAAKPEIVSWCGLTRWLGSVRDEGRTLSGPVACVSNTGMAQPV
jgi:hypothetical protein